MASYVALKRIRVGEEHLMPGDPLPDVEEARNVNLMLRQGLVADLDLQATDEEGWRAKEDAYRQRLVALEEQVAEAHEEIRTLRAAAPAGGAKEGEGAPEGTDGAEEGPETPELTEMTKAQLLDHADTQGVLVDPAANKAQIVESIRAGTASD